MITVVCVWVRGNVPFTREYVTRLRSMCERNLSTFHRFVCFTDQPRELAGMETVTVPSPGGLPGWWSKLNIFNPAHGLRGPGLYLDLDTLIVDDLTPVVQFGNHVKPNEQFLALIPHAGTFEGRGDGLKVVKRYNSSVMRLNLGTCASLYSDWTPDVGQRLWGDQDWIGETKPKLPTMPLEWFPRLSELERTAAGALDIPSTAKVVLCKKPKNHEAAARWPWFDQAWR